MPILILAFGSALLLMYVIGIGFIAPKPWAIYGYFIILTALPKHLRLYYFTDGRYDFPTGITVFVVVEAAAILGIVAAMVRSRPAARSVARLSLKLIAFSLLMVVVADALPYVGIATPASAEMHDWLAVVLEPRLRILPFLSLFYGFVVILGCLRLIRTFQQAEVILLILFVGGIEIGTEAILIYHLGLMRSVAGWAIEASGRFQGLVFADIDTAAVFAVISTICGWYFAFAKRWRWAMWLWPITFIPIPASFQRGVILALMAGFLIIWLRVPRSLLKLAGGLICVTGVALVTALGLGGDLVGYVTTGLGGSVRSDYLSTSSLEGRFAYQLRGADVLAYLFPAGAGPNMVPYAMNDVAVPSTFGDFAFDQNRQLYDSLVDGTRRTGLHCMPYEFLIEHGAVGLAAMLVFVGALARRFGSWYRRRRRDGPTLSHGAEAVVFAALVAIGTHEVFDSTRLPYSLYGVLTYLVFALPAFAEAGASRASMASHTAVDRLRLAPRPAMSDAGW